MELRKRSSRDTQEEVDLCSVASVPVSELESDKSRHSTLHHLSFLKFSSASSSVVHAVVLVRPGFVLLAGFTLNSGRALTSDKISNELESLAELIVYEVTVSL